MAPSSVLRMVAGCAVLWAAAARAGEDTLLLPIDAGGAVPPEQLVRIDAALAEYSARMRVVGTPERLGSHRINCGESAECWADVGRELKGRRVVGATLSPAGRHRFLISVVLVDVPSGSILSQARREMPESSLPRAARKLMAEVLWQAPVSRPNTVLGEPWDDPSAGRLRLLPALKWTFAGAALAAIAVGAGLWGADGTQACDLGPSQRQCPELNDTFIAGVTVVAAGAALAVTSIAFFILDRSASSRPRWAATVAPLSSGAFASASVSF